MGWSIGYDEQWQRDIGYGVPAYCDHPGCDAEIDRGLGHICEDPQCACGKFYCAQHRYDTTAHNHDAPPSREHPLWIEHVLTHSSWQKCRDQNPAKVAPLAAAASASAPEGGSHG
ncbi:hypothetical protein GIY21_00790 [Xanthomonas sontii]|uniref:AN1-type domain-containing protein n=1 Tax=Xanthomonas sontii TaxID=2650745 RepID=A0A6N7Q3K4_9XANT|nr:hypothetical protein [Xanthomonas sontii]MRG98823.1 hypothetical protein [Xanthomonas sontii]MRH73386.1 hypothetical protein [Xanthomonas sontii]